MTVILEIDHTVSKEEIVNWIEEVLKPNTPCVWGYSFEEHHCGSCHNSHLEKENEMLKTILLDVFKKHGDLCSLCEVKGQKLPECKCMKDNECLEHIIELYGAKDERKTEEAEN